MRAEPVGPARAALGEGPLWDGGTGTLLWIDIRGARLNRTDPATGTTASTPLPEAPGAVALTARGPMVAMGQALVIGGETHARLPPGHPGRFNDGKADPAGRLWIGTANAEGRADCALWRHDGGWVPVLSGITMSNGLGWSGDGRRFHYVDTGTGCLETFACSAEGALSDRRTLLRLPAGHLPDGLSVDTLGRIWLAVWGGGCVLCVTPEGRIDRRIDLPTPLVTSCAFGDGDLGTLYITTARPDGVAGPLDGALLAVRTGAEGVPVAQVTLHPAPAPSRDRRG